MAKKPETTEPTMEDRVALLEKLLREHGILPTEPEAE